MTIQDYNRAYKSKLKSIFRSKGLGGEIVGIYRGARSLSYSLLINNPLQLKDTLSIGENLALACKSPNVLSYRDKGVIVYQVELPEDQWLEYFRERDVTGLQVGLTDQKQPVEYSFDPPHSLVVGTTGAGKTYTVISILLGLCETYSPDELEIVVCDPHYDLSVFENEEHMVKFEWGSIASTYDDITNAVTWVHNQLMRRIRNNLKDEKSIVLVIDESEAICASNKDVLKMLVDIGNQSRKFGIYLIVTAKKPTQASLPNLLNTLSNRWCGKTSLDKGSVTRLLGQAININSLTDRGDFVHFDPDGIKRFLVATIQDKDYINLVRTEKSPVFINKEDVTLPEIGPGRPSDPIRMDILSFYWRYGPNVEYPVVEKTFGISRYFHQKYCDLIREFGKNYLIYRRQN